MVLASESMRGAASHRGSSIQPPSAPPVHRDHRPGGSRHRQCTATGRAWHVRRVAQHNVERADFGGPRPAAQMRVYADAGGESVRPRATHCCRGHVELSDRARTCGRRVDRDEATCGAQIGHPAPPQVDAGHARIGGVTREFDNEITEQHPEERSCARAPTAPPMPGSSP